MLVQWQVIRIDRAGRVIKGKKYNTAAAAKQIATKTRKQFPADHVSIVNCFSVPARSMFDHILSEGLLTDSMFA